MTLPLDTLKNDESTLDNYIRDNIIRLNEMGIKTYWCCSGINEDHPGNEELFSDPNLVFGSRHKASLETFWLCAYLILDYKSNTPLVPGWNRAETQLSYQGGYPWRIRYELDEFFEDSGSWKVNDARVKRLWDRLFDFLFEHNTLHWRNKNESFTAS